MSYIISSKYLLVSFRSLSKLREESKMDLFIITVEKAGKIGAS